MVQEIILRTFVENRTGFESYGPCNCTPHTISTKVAPLIEKKGTYQLFDKTARVVAVRSYNRPTERRSHDQKSHIMLAGRIQAATKLLLSKANGLGILPLNMIVTQGEGDELRNSIVKYILESKHPPSSEMLPGANESNGDQISRVHPVIFESIDGTCIQAAALQYRGSAGPS